MCTLHLTQTPSKSRDHLFSRLEGLPDVEVDAGSVERSGFGLAWSL